MVVDADNIRCLVRADYARRVRITDNLSKYQAQTVVGQLREMDILSNKLIVVEFSSDGGMHDGAMLVYDNLHALRSETVGIVYSRCYSSAFIMLQACKYRYAFRNSQLNLHNNYFNLKVSPNQDEEVAAEMLKQQIRRLRAERENCIKKLLGFRLGSFYTASEIEGFMDRDQVMSAEEALERRFLDGIIEL